MKRLPEALQCRCLCDNCHDDCHYSSYHCKHAEEDGLEYGAYEHKGFCAHTGYMPKHSWKREYDLTPPSWQATLFHREEKATVSV